MSSNSNISAASMQLFAQQSVQTKTAAANAAGSAQASFAAALNAVNASNGVDKTNVTTASGVTGIASAAKSSLARGTAAVATTDIASSVATQMLNILT